MNETDRRRGAFIASAPLLSAVLVLTAFAGSAALFFSLFGDSEMIAQQIRNPKAWLEWTGAGITAIAAIVAAFRIHVRGRTPLWRFVPLTIFGVWNIASIYASRDVVLDRPAEQILFGHSPDCVLFILACSIPIAAILFWILRWHRTEMTSSTAAMTGLGAAAMSVWLMQFFHKFEMSFGDWSIHFLAIGIVVGSAVYTRQLFPAR